jgi:DNA-binding protein
MATSTEASDVQMVFEKARSRQTSRIVSTGKLVNDKATRNVEIHRIKGAMTIVPSRAVRGILRFIEVQTLLGRSRA